LDFKFISKFLDNDKNRPNTSSVSGAFYSDYEEALNKGYGDVVEILLDNSVVLDVEPTKLLGDIHITLDDLSDNKNLPDKEFYSKLLESAKGVYEKDGHEEYLRYLSYFNKIVYTGIVLIIKIPNYLGDGKGMVEITLRSSKGFSNGQILKAIAKHIPTKDEIREDYIQYIINDPYEKLNEIENVRNDIIIRSSDRTQLIRNRYNKYLKDYNNRFPKDKLEELVRHPKEFAEYIIEVEDRYFGYGDHIYFQGLYKHDNHYEMSLGS